MHDFNIKVPGVIRLSAEYLLNPQAMTRPYSLLGAVCLAVVYSSIGLLSESVRPCPPTDTMVLLMIPAIVAGIPFGVWLPHARAGIMGDIWHVPRHTLLLPRWLVSLIGTSSIGAALGFLVLAATTDTAYFGWFAAQLVVTTAFVYSARKRYLRHPLSEFVMPFPYPLRRRM